MIFRARYNDFEVNNLKRYERIANLRVDKDISQSEIASFLNVTQRSYSRYETGTSNIPLEILSKIADYYCVSTDYLLNRTDVKEPYIKAKQKNGSML
jgi:transcriptional regulator with XRE-family HTH domain